MKNIIKKGSALVLAAALLGTTSGTTLLLNGQINAPASITATATDWITHENDSITFNPDMISVELLRESKTVLNSTYSKNIIGCKEFSSLIFQNARITITLKGQNLSISNPILCLTSKFDGWNFQRDYSPVSIGKNNEGNYVLSYDVFIKGTSSSYRLKTGITGVKSVSSTIEPNEPSNRSYYYLKADSPGEDLYIKVRKDDSIHTLLYKMWARNLCIYINSLSEMTNVKQKSLLICFDEEKSFFDELKGSKSAHYSDSFMNGIRDGDGFVGIPTDFTDEIINQLKTSTGTIPWTFIHELGHAYNGNNGILSDFNKYNLCEDDFFTNVRSLTAIQNCNNLKTKQIFIYNNNKSKYYTYNNITDNIDVGNNTLDSEYIYYTFAKKLCTLANNKEKSGQLGWDALEKFYAVQTATGQTPPLSELNHNAPINKVYLGYINNWTKIKYPENTGPLKMTLALRRLYMITHKEKSPQRDDFINFLNENFTRDYIIALYNYIRNKQ